MTAFGKIVKKQLIDQDMLQKELAQKVGISEVTLSRYLTEERNPSLQTAVKIMLAAGIKTVEVERLVDKK